MPRLVLVVGAGRVRQDHPVTQWLTSDDGPQRADRITWRGCPSTTATPTCARFLTHLVAALRTTNPDVGADALALLESDRGSERTDVLVSLVNDLDTAAERDGARARRLPRHRRGRRPRGGRRSCSTTCRRRSPSPSRPAPTRRCRCLGCAPAASSSRSGPPTCGSPPTRPTSFLNEVMGLDLEPDARRGARGPDRGLGGRAAAGRPLGPRPAPDGGRRRVRRGVHRQPPVRPRLPASTRCCAASPTTSGRSCSTPRCCES